jgi:hypothetical protein
MKKRFPGRKRFELKILLFTILSSENFLKAVPTGLVSGGVMMTMRVVD